MAFALDDLRGQTFGLLTVFERADNNEYGLVYWRLRCVCGAVVERRANTLRAGKFYTCGRPECRFWEKVNKDGPLLPGQSLTCWVWTGATKESGYGVMKWPGAARVVRAHVLSYEMHIAPKPEGLWVLHTCDNRVCVRPDHLFLGTHQDNMKDMAVKGRAATKEAKVYLAPSEKKRMIQLHSQGGLSYPKLAADFGVSLTTVRRVLRRAPHKE